MSTLRETLALVLHDIIGKGVGDLAPFDDRTPAQQARMYALADAVLATIEAAGYVIVPRELSVAMPPPARKDLAP